MGFQDCGVIPIHRGNCSDVSPSYETNPRKVTFEVATELYIITIICFVGLVGNFISIVVLRKDYDRKEAMLLLQILAVVDAFYLMVALLCYPLKHIMTSSPTVYIKMQLYIYPLLKVAQCMCIWTLVLVTVDRYVYVCKPLRAIRILTPRRRRLLACGVVLFSVIYNLPRFFDSCFMILQDACTGEIIKQINVILPSFNNDIYYNTYTLGCYLVLVFILPLTCLTVLNTKLVMTIRRSRKRHRDLGGPQEEGDSNSTLVLVIIIVIFTVCESPELIVNLMTLIDRSSSVVNISVDTFNIAIKINEVLKVLNSSTNFFIYLTLSRRFRLVLKRMLVRVIKSKSSTFSIAETVPLQNG